MRKFALAVAALFACVSLTIAAEVVFVKYDKDKKELTVKEDDKEKTYKITDETKIKAGDKELNTEKALGRLEKAKEGKTKFEISTSGDRITELKFKEGKKKQDK